MPTLGQYMSDLKMKDWKHDLESYMRWTRMGDISTVLKSIEFAAERKQVIRDKWPNQSRIFDEIDREVFQDE